MTFLIKVVAFTLVALAFYGTYLYWTLLLDLSYEDDSEQRPNHAFSWNNSLTKEEKKKKNNLILAVALYLGVFCAVVIPI